MEESFSHIMSQFDRRLSRIEVTVDHILETVEAKSNHLDDRIRELENKQSAVRGGWTVITTIGTIAGAAGSYIAKFIEHHLSPN